MDLNKIENKRSDNRYSKSNHYITYFHKNREGCRNLAKNQFHNKQKYHICE